MSAHLFSELYCSYCIAYIAWSCCVVLARHWLITGMRLLMLFTTLNQTTVDLMVDVCIPLSTTLR